MTQDTEDVVALSDEAIEAAAYQLRAVLDDGYDYETALSSALEMLGVETKLQSLSARIDELTLALESIAALADSHDDRMIEDQARAALHQEGIAPK